MARTPRDLPGIRVPEWGADVFLRRMGTLDFPAWGRLGRGKAWLRPLQRVGLNHLAAWICVLCGWYNPINLTVEKV